MQLHSRLQKHDTKYVSGLTLRVPLENIFGFRTFLLNLELHSGACSVHTGFFTRTRKCRSVFMPTSDNNIPSVIPKDRFNLVFQ